MHDAKKELSNKQFRPLWSEPLKTAKLGGGAMVAATAPLYCTPLIGHTLEAEMDELIGST